MTSGPYDSNSKMEYMFTTIQSAVVTNASSFNMTMSEVEKYRQELSDQMALTLLPAILVLSIVLLIGGVGNTLVFYIYFFKFNPSSTRSAILALACFDLVTCALCIPGEIVDLRLSYNFTSEFLCKSLRLVTTATLMSSGLTLLVVAWDRYQRICHPLNDQLTASKARNRVLIVCSLSVILSIPAAVVYGLALVPTPIKGVYGIECSTSQDFASHPLRHAHNAILMVVFSVSFTIMIVLYLCIGRQVLRQNHFRHSVRKPEKGPRVMNRRNTICSDNGEEDGEHSVSDGAKELSISHEVPPEKDEPSSISAATKPPQTTTKVSRRPSVLRRLRKMSRAGDNRTRKTTLMLFFITLVFVISFLPHLVLKVVQGINMSFKDNLTTTGIVFYNIFVRSHFFNTVANAFIYGFCSPKFRHECRALILKMAFWVKKRKTSAHSDEIR